MYNGQIGEVSGIKERIMLFWIKNTFDQNVSKRMLEPLVRPVHGLIFIILYSKYLGISHLIK